MSVSIKVLEIGDQLWQSKRQKMGNTTISHVVWHPVWIKDIDPELKWAMVSWNGNPARKVFARDGKLPYRRTKPEK